MGQKWKRDKGKNGREIKAEMGQNWKTDKGKNGAKMEDRQRQK
jgi:hypothetical protein